MVVVLISVPSVCSQSEVFPVVGGVFVGLFPCGKGGYICQVALLLTIIVELWRYGSVMCRWVCWLVLISVHEAVVCTSSYCQ